MRNVFRPGESADRRDISAELLMKNEVVTTALDLRSHESRVALHAPFPVQHAPNSPWTRGPRFAASRGTQAARTTTFFTSLGKDSDDDRRNRRARRW